MNRLKRAIRAWRGAPLANEYPRIVMLGGGLWTEVNGPDDERKTREWLGRVSKWDGEHS